MYISVKYFDPAIHKMCRTFEPYEYEHWGTNIYTYETMEKIILDLENDGGWDNLMLQLKLMMKHFPNYKYIDFMGSFLMKTESLLCGHPLLEAVGFK